MVEVEPAPQQSRENDCDLRPRREVRLKDRVNPGRWRGLAWRCILLTAFKHASRVRVTWVSTGSNRCYLRKQDFAGVLEVERAVSNLAELHSRLEPGFGRVEPFMQAGKYVAALMSDLPRKNGWTIAEHAGDLTPDRTQRLLNHTVWDHDEAMAVVRRYVVAHLDGQPLRVAALDESGQEKQGEHTAGVKRQYMGCAGRVANGVNTVYCSYANLGGHALIGARIYLPLISSPTRVAVGVWYSGEGGVPDQPQLVQDILADAIADHTMPLWCAGDEVYGRSGKLRAFLEQSGIGYVMRVGCAFSAELAPGRWMRADAVVATNLTSKKHQQRWQNCSVAGSKGERAYAWAWIATTSPRHCLLIRKHLNTEELAYHYCHLLPGTPVTLMTLVRVACLRWSVEENFEFGKDHFGLDHSQVRLHTVLLRHIVLTMAALAVCAVTAAQAKTRVPTPILSTTPDEQATDDPDLIALTVTKIKSLFNLLTRHLRPEIQHLHWIWWRRRHQARARWFHHRTLLRRQTATT